MKAKWIKSVSVILVLLLMLPTAALAHSGRTDGSGGHRDNKNVSGLGSYHYHHGYGPHLHTNGCPYESSVAVVAKPKPKPAPAAKPTPKPEYSKVVCKFNIDGQYQQIDGINKDYNNLVEMRPLCDALGISIIEWSNATNTAICKKGDTVFSVTADSKTAKLNGEAVTLDAAPKVIDGKTLLPARFVAEAVGMYVTYDSSTNIINIQ